MKSPALIYPGAKFLAAEWIISFFPPHKHYIEPLGGAANVLLQKPRSSCETYNDISKDLVNYFRMLRDRPDDLIYAIQWTPWSREEHRLHREPTDDPIERARRFWAGCEMSISCMAFTSSGWRMSKSKHPGKSKAKSRIDVSYLYAAAMRLKGVQIECRDYREILKEYDGPENLFYLDPPYLKSTRGHSNLYHHEWDRKDHIEMAELLRDRKSKVVISGYDSNLYYELFENQGWSKRSKKFLTNTGGTRDECVWLSPNTPVRKQYKIGSMF